MRIVAKLISSGKEKEISIDKVKAILLESELTALFQGEKVQIELCVYKIYS